MKKYPQIFTLFLMVVLCASCKEENKTERTKDTITSETKDIITSPGPNSIMRTIKQDSNGNIWLASFEGIIKYDGNSFTTITNKVSASRFFSVLEDRKGNFWFASIGTGVYYYDGETFQNFTTGEGLAGNVVTTIYEDTSGIVWFGTEGGASRYDGNSFQNFTTKEGLPHKDVNAIIEDKTGKFWFGTRGDAVFYDGKTLTTLTHNGKPFKNVRSIIEDKKGAIWTSSESANTRGWSVSRYDEKSLSNEKPAVTEIKWNEQMTFGILEAQDGSIWFGTLNGVYRYDGITFNDFKG